jgi:hypothetical protein
MAFTRVRFGAAADWFVALAFLLATILVAALIVREMGTFHPAAPPAAVPAPPSGPTAGSRAQGISVPALLLLDGKQIRLGDTLESVTAQVGSPAQVGADTIEPVKLGNRVTRAYDHAGTRFVVVFEPFERKGEPRVTGIYLK